MANISYIPQYRLATGGALSGGPADVDELWSGGVRGIIDCQKEFDDAPNIVHQPGMGYIWLPVDDDGQPKPVEWFQAGYEFAKPIVERGDLVDAHCAAGFNRGPSMCYFLLRALWTLDPASAEADLRAVREVGIAYRADADRAIAELFNR